MAPNEADGAQVSTGGKAPRKQAGAGDTNQPLRHPRLHAKRRHHQCPQGHPARAPHQRSEGPSPLPCLAWPGGFFCFLGKVAPFFQISVGRLGDVFVGLDG